MQNKFFKKGGTLPPNHPDIHWKDMPEYSIEDLMPYRQLIISFKSEEDIQSFAKLLNQKINLKTKSLWYPKHDINKTEILRYDEE